MMIDATGSKPKGWFSRRHQTDAAHRAAQDKWWERKAAKMVRAREQNAASAERKARLGRAA